LNKGPDQGLKTAMEIGHIQSMTGFAQVVNRIHLGPSAASAQARADNATLLLELRSVNSRYLDLTFKIPDELRHFESLLREQISARVKRGKVECRISLKRDNASDDPLTGNKIHKEALDALLSANKHVIANALSSGLQLAPPNSLDILRWPGIWTKIPPEDELNASDIADSAAESAELDRVTLVAITEKTLDEFIKSRLREGAQTAKAMLQYGDEIDALVANLDAKLPQINAEIQKRFSDKVWERLIERPLGAGSVVDQVRASNAEKVTGLLKTEDSQNRINQELVLLAMRADVSEEITRLKAHIAELRKTLAGSGAVGKKLDFLMQEFNREANTLGSKAPNLEVSKASTELKLAIEQIREQVQNLE
jgi:uncharacterized protein (TIGR00255 family)